MTRRTRRAGELESLYESSYVRFVRVSTAIAGDEATAHDAVQEAFARALARLDTYRAEAPLEGWVWRIVVNAALAARAAKPLLADGVAEAAVTDNGSDEAGVRRWIAALPERQRLAVFLRYYADLDYRAIAAALGVEVGTVSATLSAAHRALRLSLKEVER